ncbi:MAG: hypothetical protein CL581_09475 [Alteromonadaceae bacterium]|nr:hypothetical protein [Alteromonadaceae bacterium]
MKRELQQPINHRVRRPGETRAARKRRNALRLVYGVVKVDETLKARTIMDRIIDTHGPGHQDLPRNVDALAMFLRCDDKFVKVTTLAKRRNFWRRVR